MAVDVMDEKRQAHELVDRLTPDQLSAIVGLLKVIALPVAGFQPASPH